MSANLARRNLTKGQQAIHYAMAHPEPDKGGRGLRTAKKARAVAGAGPKGTLYMTEGIIAEAA